MKKIILTLVFALGITTLAYGYHGGRGRGHDGYYDRNARGYERGYEGRGRGYNGGGYCGGYNGNRY